MSCHNWIIVGHETYVAITPTHTTTRQDLRQLPVSKRKCYFLDEFHLQLFNTYSVKNCWMESLTNFSRFNVTFVIRHKSKNNEHVDFDLDIIQNSPVVDLLWILFTNVTKNLVLRMVNSDGCVPWNFPSADEGVPICKPRERHRFLDVMWPFL